MNHAQLLGHLLALAPTKVQTAVTSTRMFFVVGLGRSGTTFLQRILSTAPELAVYHETSTDRNALVEAYWNPDAAARYLAGRRERLIAARMLSSRCHCYGEVNSYLRYHVDALQDRWSSAVFHIVRDGRAVVRSTMNRDSFTPADRDHTGRLSPQKGDPVAEQWPTMDRFQRACWYWAESNQFLIKRGLPLIRLEDVISSYEEFSNQVTTPLGIEKYRIRSGAQQHRNPRTRAETTSSQTGAIGLQSRSYNLSDCAAM